MDSRQSRHANWIVPGLSSRRVLSTPTAILTFRFWKIGRKRRGKELPVKWLAIAAFRLFLRPETAPIYMNSQTESFAAMAIGAGRRRASIWTLLLPPGLTSRP